MIDQCRDNIYMHTCRWVKTCTYVHTLHVDHLRNIYLSISTEIHGDIYESISIHTGRIPVSASVLRAVMIAGKNKVFPMYDDIIYVVSVYM